MKAFGVLSQDLSSHTVDMPSNEVSRAVLSAHRPGLSIEGPNVPQRYSCSP